MLERGAKFLKLVYESPRWRIWEVRGTDPPASNGAKLLAAGPNWFMVDASKTDRRRATATRSTGRRRRLREPRAAAAGPRSSRATSRACVMVQARFGLERRPPRKGVLAPWSLAPGVY